jgi:hypothetical protein
MPPAACECVPLLTGESTECGPRRTLAEQGQDVSAVLVPIREFIADVPAPGSDHRKHEPPTLREQRIALELALSCPARVGRLVLVSTSAAGQGKVTVSWPMRLLLPLRWLGLLRDKYPQPRYAYLRQRQASASYDATGRLGDIRVPALILHGRRDRSMPVELAERMHAGISGSRVEFFRGGHMFFLFAERQQFLDRAGRFLAE